MSSRLLPLVNQCLKLAGRTRDFQSLAADVAIMEPEETVSAIPAYFLKNQLEKVTATVHGFSTLADVIALATATKTTHAPVIRYTFKNCLVHGAGVEVLGSSFRKKKLQSFNFLTDRLTVLPRAVYCMSSVSHQFFGHWIRDACPQALLAQSGEAILMDVRPDWPHATDYVKAFSLAPMTGSLYHVETLTLYQDHAQGSSKKARINELRQRMARAFPRRSTSSQAVYFRRGQSGVVRAVVNEDEITSGLSRKGFDVFDIENSSVAEIYERTQGARVVVTMEGSHINHLYLSLSPGATLIVLVPADRFVMLHRGLAQANDHKFGFVVVDPIDGGYQVNMNDLNATLDMIS